MKDKIKEQDIHISSVYSDNENLVDLLENQHGLTLLETDINDILHAVKQDRNTGMKDPEFIKLFEGGESKEILQVENNGWIKSIAISHQKQMSSTHPHAIIGTIEDAIIEALETFKSNQ